MKASKDLLWEEDKPINEVVETCHRGDWLLWFAQNLDIGLRPLTLAKGHCANTVRHLMIDERSLKAADTAIAFGEGEATKEELYNATSNAWAAVEAFHAANATAHAAWAAYVATRSDGAWAIWAATRAAEAVYASADTSWAARAAKAKNQMQTADICRKYIGNLIIEKVNEQLKTKS